MAVGSSGGGMVDEFFLVCCGGRVWDADGGWWCW